MVEVIYQLRTIHRTSTVHLSPSLRFRIIGFIIFLKIIPLYTEIIFQTGIPLSF